MKIGVLGCGWLGLPLATHLKNKKNQVSGTTTRQEKLSLIEKEGVKAFQIQISSKEIKGDIEVFLSNLDALIIDFPPRIRSRSVDLFLNEINQLLRELSKYNKLQKIVYISSTSVFRDTSHFKVYDEAYLFSEFEKKDNPLLKAENMLLENLGKRLKVLRCGGLIGHDRHPVKYLSGRKDIANPDAPVNMTYQKDVISICQELINNFDKLENYIFHAVHPEKISRKEFYQKAAQDFSLDTPKFDHQSKQVGKRILSTHTLDQLNIEMQ